MSALYPSAAFAELLMALGSRPQEKTLDELFDALGLDEEDYLLTKLAAADRILRKCGVDIQPGLQDQPPDGTFLLRRKNAGVSSEASVRDRLPGLESASQEFKSTYWCNLRRLSHQPRATAAQLRSDAVKHSALKSVAGFLTTGGGTLFVGVSDAGEILGLRPDLEILQESHRNIDQLINNIKIDIAHRFRDGNTVNDYVSIVALDVRDDQILQLEVASRRKLSYLASPERDHQLFRRQGNRTIAVEIYELEEFQAWRSEHVLSVGP